jgi:uncharacterized protein
VKKRYFPDLYDLSNLKAARSIRAFDELYTSRAHGFKNADDYYSQSSSIRVVQQIRIPTLVIHAQDDPFIPFAPLKNPVLTENPYILFIATAHGGHVAFVGTDGGREDRFWAENRVVEFCVLTNESRPNVTS